ncbi:MAG: putative PEP-binding protein [Rubrivivax sp.]|nr:putative PEP-binding protein [Rubrivivax sp.]
MARLAGRTPARRVPDWRCKAPTQELRRPRPTTSASVRAAHSPPAAAPTGLAHADSSRGAQGFSAGRKRAPPAQLRGIKGAPGIGIGTCVLPSAAADFERVSAQQHASADTLAALRELPAQTPDGARVALQANVGLSSDLATVLDSGAEGIGLFRTEFSFMVRDSFPSADEQVRVYREVLARFAPRPVTMRTLDVGGDKGLPYFPLQEDSAFLGWRGIRLTLDSRASSWCSCAPCCAPTRAWAT